MQMQKLSSVESWLGSLITGPEAASEDRDWGCNPALRDDITG